jgi:hypothetical protein
MLGKPLTLLQILNKANKGYDEEGTLATYYYAKTGHLKPPAVMVKLGDGLARFVVVEIAETFDPDASESEQSTEAIRVMESAKRQIEGVIYALERD